MGHTRGPWIVGDQEGFWAVDCCITADDPDVGPVVVAEVVHATATEEADNMQLITAAPDLLAACEQAIETYRLMLICSHPAHPDHEALSTELNQIKAAVAKAKGVTPVNSINPLAGE